MARGRRIRQSASERAEDRARLLAELRAAPREIESVDIEDEGDVLGSLLAARTDTSAIDAGDRANERASWRQS